MKTLILLLTVLLFPSTQVGITFDSSKHCSCFELIEQDCVKMKDYCEWISPYCSEILWSCSNLDSAQCTAIGSSYRCEWINNQCQDKTYKCQDFQTNETCPGNKTQNCYWNKNNKCEQFSYCDQYDNNNCPYDQDCLTFFTGACAKYPYVTCSRLTIADTCFGWASETSYCRWTTLGTCIAVDYFALCTMLNDFKNWCQQRQDCKYTNNTCSFKQCSDISYEYMCTHAQTGPTQFTLCSWVNNNTCIPADTSALTSGNCLSQSEKNYKWTLDNKCVECVNLVSDELSVSSALLLVVVTTLLI